ncbi:MAG: RidA family protein [Burkholderiaceae bacterium]|nr:RidA family protein [Burkholderiaceae bacterium]
MEISRFEVGPRFSEMTVVDVGTAKLIYIAGQVAENTSLDVVGQTRQVLQIIDRLLAKAGADKSSIVAARIYLHSVGDYAAMNSVWDDWVAPGQAPARATIGAKLIHHEYKVEIEVTAAIKA